MPPLRLAFLGCGFIAGVHARHLRALRGAVEPSYASRDATRARAYLRSFGGGRAYGSYDEALEDPSVEAVVVAVPPRGHLGLTLRALHAGKHVLVEKPALPRLADYATVRDAERRAERVVMVAENDHYKPLAVCLRRVLAEGVIGDLLLAHFTTVARRPKPPWDWRQDEEVACGDAFFEEGIHWLHLAGSLGPRIVRVEGFRPPGSSTPAAGAERRRSTMLVAFQYDSGAAGAILYSREVPSLLRGIRLSKLYGRDGVVTFESNGGFVWVRGRGTPRLVLPGFRDIRGYRAMYRDFVAAARSGCRPEMSVERAEADHRLMEAVSASAGGDVGGQGARRPVADVRGPA